ncbi:MAG: hypothetical protein OXU53_05035 [Deltaproteobacteria bacterium]|nr:hypothetical protein [Deltaproteobacteria bacterium]
MNEDSVPHNPLLRWQEDDLNEAEKKVLTAFREGWKADGWQGEVVVSSEDSSAPEKPAEGHTADDWQDATLRASFVRDLFLGNYGKFDPRPIVISRAWIEGQLNLDYCEIRFPLAFFQCIFSDGISLRNSIIPELGLSGCEVRRSLFAQESKVTSNVFLGDGFKANGTVYLHGASIGGQLACENGHFKKSLSAQSLKTGESVFLTNGFNSTGVVYLNGANIGGQLVCKGGHFKKGLSARSLKTNKGVLLRPGFESTGVVDLQDANIGGQLECDGGRFEEGLNAQKLKTGESVFLRNDFRSTGLVDLQGANIGGELACEDGHFKKGLNAQSLKTGKDMFLRYGFESTGVVDLQGANIGGQLDCEGGHFKEDLNAQGLRTGADVFLRHGFESTGMVDLHGANIGGQLDCMGGHFKEALNARILKVGADVFLGGGFESSGIVNLFGAEINGSLDLGGATNDVMLDNAKVHGALRDLKEWPRSCSANGFCYQAIEFSSDDRDWKVGLDWVAAITESSKFSPQPYEQLMSVYRRMGHTNWARNVGFALEKKRSKEFKGFWQWLTWRPWYGILRWTIGYGYKPFRFVPWALGLVMTGFFLFSSGHYESVSKYAPACLENEWIPSEAEALESQSWRQDREPPPDYLPFNPLIYSLEATFPVLPLGQLEKWHPSNGFLLGVRWALTLIGTPLLAILALFGAGVLGPRWRSGDEGG